MEEDGFPTQLVALALCVSLIPLIVCSALLYCLDRCCISGNATHGEVPYAVTPMHIVDQMMTIAEVREGCKLYDCGCGDGRILIAAARRGACAEGFELAWWPYLLASFNALVYGRGRVRIHRRDFFDADLSDATHMLLFQLPKPLKALTSKLRREVKQTCVVVSYKYQAQADVQSICGSNHIYRHTISPDGTSTAETATVDTSRVTVVLPKSTGATLL